ncbi:NlpC/P60 family protein [Cutibacterium sp. V947]|uniref:C40 family peptidase n=1 Tax=unclassified Cutibacterium TaxID=2649671 RepID=UPI003EE0511A
MSGGTHRRGHSAAVAAITGAIVLGTVASVEPGANATPDPINQAKTRLAQLDEQAAKVQENYSRAQAALVKAQKDLKRSEKDFKAQSAKVATMRRALGRVALNDYQGGGGVSTTTQLVTSGESGEFLSKLATVQNVTDRTTEQFQAFQAQQARLASLKSQAEADRATIQAQRDQQAKLLADAKKKEQEAKAVVDRLTAHQREELARRQAAEAATNAVSRAAGRSAVQTSATAKDMAIPTPSSTSSARAQAALGFALAQVGKPYVWGGTGPNGFDCSGLMMAAWARAGLSIPRTAAEQFRVGTPVPMSDLQPGDLVFFYPGISHVGMYIGGGRFVHASNPRTGIKISNLSRHMSYQGARRLG